jgi:acetate kinase
MLVFTAGIGEHNAEIRARICHALAGLFGVALDDAANQRHAALISSPTSRVAVAVEPTNEEWIAARHAQRLTRPTQTPAAAG